MNRSMLMSFVVTHLAGCVTVPAELNPIPPMPEDMPLAAPGKSTVMLHGRKSAFSNVLLTITGSPIEVVPSDELTTWKFELPLSRGCDPAPCPTTFSLGSYGPFWRYASTETLFIYDGLPDPPVV